MRGNVPTDSGTMDCLHRPRAPGPATSPGLRSWSADHGRARRGSRGRPLAALLLVIGSLVGCSNESVFDQYSGSSAGSQTTSTTAPASTTTLAGTTTSTTTTTAPPPTTTTTTTTIPPRVSAAGTWTVMVYAMLDNNLDDYWQFEDFREMRAVTAEVPDLRFVALVDRSAGHSSEPLGRLDDWTTAKLIDISGRRFAEIDDWGESDLGHPSTLADFVQAAAAHAPADHYALVIKDHGGGMLVGPDEVPNNTVLWNSEIADALAAGLESSGIGTFDLIAFDTCLMGSLEAAWAVQPFAAYMIGSEDISYSSAFYYAGFDYLATAGDPTVEGLGRWLLSNHVDFMVEEVGIDGGTLSLLDLRRLPAFHDALAEVVQEALDSMGTSAPVFGRRLERVVKFGSDPDPGHDFAMVDLGQLLRRVARSDAPVAEAAGRAADLLAEVVVANVTGEASAGARGLSVYFPPTPSFGWIAWDGRADLYGQQGSPVWYSFLNGYFTAGRAIPPDMRPSLGPSGPETEYWFDDFGIGIAAQFNPAAVDGVVTAVLWSGVEEPDGSVTFYDSTQGFEGDDPGSGIFGGVYDLTRVLLSDGEDSAYGFTQVTFNEQITFFTLTVPLWYRAPIDPVAGRYADPVEVVLLKTYDMETDESSKGVFISNNGTLGPFTPEPRGLFFPKVAHRSPGGELEWVPSTDVGIWADMDALQVEFVDLPSGTRLRSELTISDYGGHTATAVVSVTIP